MKKNIFIIALAVYLLNACKSDSRFQNLELQEAGYYFGVFKEGSDTRNLEIGDVVYLKQIMMTEKDSVLFDWRDMLKQGEPAFAVKIMQPLYKGDMFEALLKLKKGDSAGFALRIDSMFSNYYKQPAPDFLKGNEYIRYYLKIDSVIPKENVAKIEADQEKKRMELLTAMKLQEDSLLNDHLVKNKITTKPTSSGLYITELKKGSGKKINQGDTVTVNYVGKFIDGTVFDDSKSHPEPFSFAAGTGMVIPGWDEALLSMSEGGKVSLVVPSKLAYGEQGAQETIPPYATLLFEMEVISVKPSKK